MLSVDVRGPRRGDVVSTLPLRLRVAHGPRRTLADVEAVCADARAQGFGDAAEVLPASVLFDGSLVIVEPYVEQPAGGDA